MRAGTVAHTREIESLITIRRVFQEVNRRLQSLTALLQKWQIERSSNGGRSWTSTMYRWGAMITDQPSQIPRRVVATVQTSKNDKMCKRVLQNSQFRVGWRELVHSTDKNEQILAITIKMEWCERPETPDRRCYSTYLIGDIRACTSKSTNTTVRRKIKEMLSDITPWSWTAVRSGAICPHRVSFVRKTHSIRRVFSHLQCITSPPPLIRGSILYSKTWTVSDLNYYRRSLIREELHAKGERYGLKIEGAIADL